MKNHKNHMFLKPLKAQTMWKTLEMIIAKRMQNMGQIENKSIIFVAKIHFDIFCIRWKIMGGSGSRSWTFAVGNLDKRIKMVKKKVQNQKQIKLTMQKHFGLEQKVI